MLGNDDDDDDDDDNNKNMPFFFSTTSAMYCIYCVWLMACDLWPLIKFQNKVRASKVPVVVFVHFHSSVVW